MTSEHKRISDGALPFEDLFLPAPFVEKSAHLLAINNTMHHQGHIISDHDHKQIFSQLSSAPALSLSGFPRIEHDACILQQYFSAARDTLTNLCTETDAEKFHASLPTIRNLTDWIFRAGEFLPKLTTALETIKRAQDATAEQTITSKTTQRSSQPNEQTAELRHHSDSSVTVTPEQLNTVAASIDAATTDWRDLLALTATLDVRADLACEWADLASTVFTGVETAISKLHDSFELVNTAAAANKMFTEYIGSPSVVLESLKRAVPPGARRLPYQTDEEKQIVLKYYEIYQKLRPLQASIEILLLRLAGYDQRAIHVYPRSVSRLHRKYSDLRKHLAELTNALSELGARLFFTSEVNTALDTSGKGNTSVWECLLKSLCRHVDTLLSKNQLDLKAKTELSDCSAIIEAAATPAKGNSMLVVPLKLKEFEAYLRTHCDKLRWNKALNIKAGSAAKTSVTSLPEHRRAKLPGQLPTRRSFSQFQPVPIRYSRPLSSSSYLARGVSSSSTASSCTNSPTINDCSSSSGNGGDTADTTPATSPDFKPATLSIASLDDAVAALSLETTRTVVTGKSTFSLKDGAGATSTFYNFTAFPTSEISPSPSMEKSNAPFQSTSTQNDTPAGLARDFSFGSTNDKPVKPSSLSHTQAKIELPDSNPIAYRPNLDPIMDQPVTENPGENSIDTNDKPVTNNNNSNNNHNSLHNPFSSFNIYRPPGQLDNSSSGPRTQTRPTRKYRAHSSETYHQRSKLFGSVTGVETEQFVFSETPKISTASLSEEGPYTNDASQFVRAPAATPSINRLRRTRSVLASPSFINRHQR